MRRFFQTVPAALMALSTMLLIGLGCSGENPSAPHSVDGSPLETETYAFAKGGEPPSARNLIRNPGFEMGFNFWDPLSPPYGWAISTGNPRSGSACLTFTVPGGAGMFTGELITDGYCFLVEENTPYRLSYWLRKERPDEIPNDTIPQVIMAGVLLNGFMHWALPAEASQSWQIANRTVTFPEGGCAYLYFYFWGDATEGTCVLALDDIRLRKQ